MWAYLKILEANTKKINLLSEEGKLGKLALTRFSSWCWASKLMRDSEPCVMLEA